VHNAFSLLKSPLLAEETYDADGCVELNKLRRVIELMLERIGKQLGSFTDENPDRRIRWARCRLENSKTHDVLLGGKPEAAALVHSAIEDLRRNLPPSFVSSCTSRSGARHRPF
jgi:hypothetical protein